MLVLVSMCVRARVCVNARACVLVCTCACIESLYSVCVYARTLRMYMLARGCVVSG